MIKALLASIFLLSAYLANATTLKLRADSLQDTVRHDFVSKMKRFSEQSAIKSSQELAADRLALRQNEVIESVKKATQKAKNYLKRGIDTLAIQQELRQLSTWHQLAGDGIFTNQGNTHTNRNLTTSYNILTVLANSVASRKSHVDRYQTDLSNFRLQIDSLSNDSALFKFPSDSVELTKYLQKIVVLAYEVSPVDSALKVAINNVQVLQNQINLEAFKLASNQEEINVFQQEVSDKLFQREFVNIWEQTDFSRPFREILSFSEIKSWLVLRFYVQSHPGKVFIFISMVGICLFYIRSLRKLYLTNQSLAGNTNSQLILRYPLLSALIIISCVFQFIFPSPPFIFSAILWICAALSLSFIFQTFISTYWMRVWLFILILFTLACLNNLILQASRPERWIMLCLATVGFVFGSFIILKGRHHELRERWILYPIGFMALLALASVAANVFGRYNLSKTLLMAGYSNVVIAILFLWTVRLVNEGLTLAASVYTHQEKKLFFLNYNRIGKKAPTFFYAFLIIGWFILFGKHFYAFRQISDPFKDFLSEDRSLGDYTFTINSLLVFIIIMVLTTVVSRIVSFFAADQQWNGRPSEQEKKLKIGSWLLLIRITIIVLGLFLAFAAVGIPMDRITLILGALGVGIGFGLQSLVNNLVSGLVIAFEKPLNVGDLVEVGGQGGTVKSIGFRSSVISTSEGADLVLPNGDLLNSHVTNWTSGGFKKRMTISVGIAYGTDLEKVRSLLIDKFSGDDRILKYPAPLIHFQQFNSSSIDINIFFWVKNIKEGLTTKSDMIVAIDKLFKANDIVIPFPQQDIYLHQTQSEEKEKGETL
ncbi:mechanosensitive ion channel family protein [Olivibacter domesticus]|uniref:Small-conductance mechanosensitive channel n=1 Tax=Olivibacter domesticus TaxID=407022 RepID=A0A1H7K9G0_OLID1|nr:mechanosensitive ion channel domain-containing protein [Olivibacter domesticus]SEK82545.1 Small-conductance mechanosensitive channel [Olivibacter domesticus]